MRERPEQIKNQVKAVREELLISALAGSSALLKFLKSDEAIDILVAEIMSQPQGELATLLLPELKKFCNAEALEIIKDFVENEATPIRRNS